MLQGPRIGIWRVLKGLAYGRLDMERATSYVGADAETYLKGAATAGVHVYRSQYSVGGSSFVVGRADRLGSLIVPAYSPTTREKWYAI